MYGRGHAQGYGNTRARGRGRSYGNGNSKVIDLPDGISPGVIIGPGADNLKWLKRETGVSRINVTDHGITINGHPSAISAAERLLNGQIQALLNQAGTGFIPRYTRVVFLDIPNRLLALQVVACPGGTGRPQEAGPLRISTAQGHTTSAASLEVDALETQLNMMPTLTAPTGSSTLVTKFLYSATDYGAALSSVAFTASHAQKQGMTMKIRANLGTQGFKWARGANLGYSLQNLEVAQTKLRDGLLLPKWGNGIDPQSVARLKAAAAASGFVQNEHKAVHSLHLLDRAHMSSHKLSFREDECGLHLRKISSDREKLEVAAMCSGTGTGNGYRLKLLGQRDGPTGEINRQLASIAAQCTLKGGRLLVPQCSFDPDITRRKDKQVFSAVLDSKGRASDGGEEVRLTFTQVFDNSGEAHNEIAISCPALNMALNRPGGSAAVDEQLHRFVAVCKRLASSNYC